MKDVAIGDWPFLFLIFLFEAVLAGTVNFFRHFMNLTYCKVFLGFIYLLYQLSRVLAILSTSIL